MRHTAWHSTEMKTWWAGVVAAMATCMLTAGCSSTSSTDGGTDAQPLEAGFADAGLDAGDAGFDAGSVGDPDAATMDASAPQQPMRCLGESIPGFAALGDGWFRPCNCFDGTPLRPVPTDFDEGLRTIPFDCSWPVGMLYQRWSSTSGPIAITATTCEYVNNAPQGGGFVPEPVEERFIAFTDALPDGVTADRLCVPTECVFETPGEPPRCSDDCGIVAVGSGDYLTTYRVDRSACPP